MPEPSEQARSSQHMENQHKKMRRNTASNCDGRGKIAVASLFWPDEMSGVVCCRRLHPPVTHSQADLHLNRHTVLECMCLQRLVVRAQPAGSGQQDAHASQVSLSSRVAMEACIFQHVPTAAPPCAYSKSTYSHTYSHSARLQSLFRQHSLIGHAQLSSALHTREPSNHLSQC